MEPYSRGILLAALAAVETYGEIPDAQWSGADSFCRDGIGYTPREWADSTELTATERKRYSRALERLERSGLLQRVPFPASSRTAFVRLTAAGVKATIGMAANAADLAAVLRGLRRTDWGKAVAAEVSWWAEPTLLHVVVAARRDRKIHKL